MWSNLGYIFEELKHFDSSKSSMTFPANERAFLGDSASFMGKFILAKGVTKYVGIYGSFLVAAAAGYRASGEGIVDFTDPATHAIDSVVSDLTGYDVTPTETSLLPFAYFVEHINSLSPQMAVAELVVFSLIGYALTRLRKTL